LKSNESDLSTKPIPINAALPESSLILITKYLAESDTLSMATLGNSSIGHAAKSSPVFLSSNFKFNLVFTATILSLPLQSGASNFQSAALFY
jgi:hypothetical protein